MSVQEHTTEPTQAPETTLRQLAIEAGGEPWEYEQTDREYDDGWSGHYHAVRTVMARWGSSEVGEVHHESAARFMAAANPAVVIGLLDEIELLKERLSPPLFSEYAASKEQIEAQRAANAELEAENGALARANSRLLGLMSNVLHGYERVKEAELIEKSDA